MSTRQGIFPRRPAASRLYLETVSPNGTGALRFARGKPQSLGKREPCCCSRAAELSLVFSKHSAIFRHDVPCLAGKASSMDSEPSP